MLDKIIAAASINQCHDSNVNDDDQDSVDDDFDDNMDMDSDENLDDSVEREGQDSDVNNDVGNLVDERNTPDENTSAPEIIAFIPPPDSSNLEQPVCSGSKDYHHSMSDSSADRAFATLIVRTTYILLRNGTDNMSFTIFSSHISVQLCSVLYLPILNRFYISL